MSDRKNTSEEAIDDISKRTGASPQEAREMYEKLRFDGYFLNFMHQFVITIVISGASFVFDDQPMSVSTAAAIALAVSSYETGETSSAIMYAAKGQSVVYAFLAVLSSVALLSPPFIVSSVIAALVSSVYQ